MNHPSLIILLLISCLYVNVECLGQEHYDLIRHLMQKSSACTTLLYRLDKTDANLISEMAENNPILILNDSDSPVKEMIQEQLSVRKSRCALLFAVSYTLDENVIEYLLNETKHRTVYVMSSVADNFFPHKFQPYFLDCVIFIQKSSSGNLLMSVQVLNFSKPIGKIMWLGKARTMLRITGNDKAINTDRSSLRNRNISVAYLIYPPFLTPLKDNRISGTDGEIFNIISKKIGFHYSLKLEIFWLFKNPKTSQLIGSIGSVASGECQIALTVPFNLRNGNERLPVSLSPQMYSIDFVYLVPKAKELSPFDNFVRPFSLSVWICILASWVTFTITAYVFNKVHGNASLSLLRIALDLFGTTWQQNLKDSLVSPSTGLYFIIFGFWIIGMTFKGCAYTCNLRAFMVMKEYEKPMRTDKDILGRNADLYFQLGSGTIEEFQNSTSAIKRELVARTLKRNTTFASLAIGAGEEKMIRDGGARVSIEARVQYALPDFEKHFGYQPLQAVRVEGLNWMGGMVAQRLQPWSEEVDRTLLQLLAAGIVDLFWRRYVTDKNIVEDDEDDLEPYQIKHIAGSLTVLACGLALSFAVACLEVAHFHLVRKKFVEDGSNLEQQ